MYEGVVLPKDPLSKGPERVLVESRSQDPGHKDSKYIQETDQLGGRPSVADGALRIYSN
jgi:hypothetical protein